MVSDAVKVAREQRKAERERMLYEAIGKALDGALGLLQSDAISLLTAWVITEVLQNSRAPWADPSRPSSDPSTHWIGPIAAGGIEATLLAGFALNGFKESRR